MGRDHQSRAGNPGHDPGDDRKVGRVASWLARLMAGAAPLPQAARAGLLSANDWLRVTSQIAASESDPAADRTAGCELLRGIPIAIAPERIAPRVGESTTDLSAGIAATAHRLRAAAFIMGEAAHTSPYFSGPAWRWTALSAAIVSDTCTATLHTLADRAADLAAPSVPPGKLREAAKAFGPACAAWRQAASMWQVITTDTQTAATPATVE